MQYGLIPEFIGRLPVTSAVHQLSREDLITILTEPRNAIVNAEPLTDKEPELAYVTAWAKWRAGDGAAAWEAILTAAKGWGNAQQSE